MNKPESVLTDEEGHRAVNSTKTGTSREIFRAVEQAVLAKLAEKAEQVFSCAECGKTSTKDPMWALYCMDCIGTHRLGALDGELVLVPNYEAVIDEYIEDYEMLGETEDGRDACYTPNEKDKALLKDAFMGFDFSTLYTNPPTTAALPTMADALAAGDGTLQYAIDVAQERAAVAERNAAALLEAAEKAKATLEEFEFPVTDESTLSSPPQCADCVGDEKHGHADNCKIQEAITELRAAIEAHKGEV